MQAVILLNGNNACTKFQKLLRHDTEAGTNFQHAVPPGDVRGGQQDVEDVAIHQEVLSQCTARVKSKARHQRSHIRKARQAKGGLHR